MIKKIVLSIMMLSAVASASASASASALSHPCVVIGRSVDMSMINAMRDDMGIDMKNIDMDKTTFEILGQYPVNRAFAEFLTDSVPMKYKFVKRKDILSLYTDDNPLNLIVKYSYYNYKNQNNVFIGSNIVNDDECSVKFTGYVIVKREF